MIYKWLLKFSHSTIDDDCSASTGLPLLKRWFLLRLGPLNITPSSSTGKCERRYCLMLHCFLRSDNDRAFHDHPWSFITFLLSPYIEHTPHGVFRRRRFSLLYRPAEWQHWVEVVQPRTWTIILHLRRRREWGFITNRGWVHWLKYVNADRCK